MEEDTDLPAERETKDFHFRQLKKIRLFDHPQDLPRERSNLLAISNKYGLLFAGGPPGLKIYHTKNVLIPNQSGEDPNKIAAVGVPSTVVPMKFPVHHVALSSDNLTLSVCMTSGDYGTFISFYDVRTLVNESKPQKHAFAYYKLAKEASCTVSDLKWNPAIPTMVASCLSDGSISVLQVTDTVSLFANLPATLGVTSVCWSPKGKQLAVGKQNGTVVQYLPNLQEKKVIPCPSFYDSENPVKVLDVLWVSTYVFAVVYAAADGSLETPPQLVVVLLPKKEDKRGERFLNFTETCYSSCSERQHHYFMNHIEDWEILLGASAASIEVSVIAKPLDQVNWELWLLEDASRAELPVTDNSDDTLPMGVVVDYSSQLEIFISEEKILPPAPVLLMLSTDGVLCPFHMINLNPSAKSLSVALEQLPVEGERQMKTVGTTVASPASAGSPAASSQPAPPALGVPPAGPAANASAASASFSFSPAAASAKPANPSVFSFQPAQALSAFGAGSFKPDSVATSAQAGAGSSFTPSASTVKVNLKDKFSALETPPSLSSTNLGAASFSFTSPSKLSTAGAPHGQTIPFPSPAVVPTSKAPAAAAAANAGVTPSAQNAPMASAQKTARVAAPPTARPAPAQPQANMEKQVRLLKESDPVLIGIAEEIAHFQKEMDELKARTAKACFLVGTEEQMRQLRSESDDLHSFLLEIKETTEYLHGDIGSLKTTLLEGFGGVEDAKEQNERKRDPGYRHLLYKKPLDPKSEAQMQEIRRLHQYVKFAVQDVSDVLDLEWDRHLEKKRKQKGMIIPERETLFNTLANNQEIINQQRQRLNQLVENLQQLRLYNQTSQWSMPCEDSSIQSIDAELEHLRNALSKTILDTPAKTLPKLPPKLSSVKQTQLRNFLTKRKTPPIRSLAPASLSRSSFLAPSYYEDLDDVSSASSLSEAADNEDRQIPPQEVARHATPPPEATPVRAVRHTPVVRTTSVQPGFVSPTPAFGKPQINLGPASGLLAASVQSIRVMPPGADSTMLATKTVKHGAPSVPAPHAAAAAAALRRQIANQTPATLTESTLQTVPQVVNVKELKGNGPGPNIVTVMGPSVPHSAAQVIHQVLATVASNQAKQGLPASALKMHPMSTPVAGQPAHGPAFCKTAGQASPKPEAAAASPVSAAPASAAASQLSKPFSFPPAGAGFSFGNAAASSSTIGNATAGGAAPARDPNQTASFAFGGGNKPLFGPGSESSFSFGSLKPPTSSPSPSPGDAPTNGIPASAAATSLQPPVAAASGNLEAQVATPGDGLFQSFSGGETLGSFSGLRVGQVEEAPRAELPKAPPSMQPAVLPSSSPVFGYAAGLPPAKPGDADSTVSSSSGGSVLGNVQLTSAGAAPSLFNQVGIKPSLSFGLPPPSAAPPVDPASAAQASAALAFGSLVSAPNAFPPAAPSSGTVEIKQPDKPPTNEPATPCPQQQPLTAQTREVVREEPAATPAASPAVATIPLAPPAVTVHSAAPPAVETRAEVAPLPIPPATVGSDPNASVTSTPVLVTAPTPAVSIPPASGYLPSQTPVLVTPATPQASDNPPVLPHPGEASAAGSAFAQPAVTTASSPAAAPTFGQAPAAGAVPTPFAQAGNSVSTSTSSSTGFGPPAFGVAGASGSFGQPTFGQAPAFWKPPANSASNFSFAQSGFGTQPAFGQPASSTAVSGSGDLFGSSATANNANSFSFGQLANGSGTSSTGGGLFGQISAPVFGQSTSFGQGAPVFGSASASTTTTSSSGFSFGQPPGFASASPGTVFGQPQNSSPSVFGQQPASSGGGLFGTRSGGGGGGGGFFSGLGGKPSQEAANKNPFGSSTSGFGSSTTSNSTSLFGDSGAKTFGFGNSAFGDQKSSGTFSAGGSVASQGFGFSSPTKTGGFGAAPVFGSPPTFGGSPGFGGVPAFGSAPGFASPLGSAGGKVFGEGTIAANTGGFGFGGGSSNTTFGSLATQNTPTFGALSQQPSSFGGQSGGFSGFGSGGGGAPAGSSGGFGFGVSNQSSSSSEFSGWRG
ncbi:nuclear pore complex protein Nup214 isoform X3 [Ascaphus truei]|uniref:nuclear pore complex protein Nup214 isoform X3 n=1 Tax=Ascaphus truei TaxID=8439 RepID=UPI003F5AA692